MTMKNIFKKPYVIGLFFTAMLFSCAELDLVLPSEGSNENWYSDQTEKEMSLNDLYTIYVWDLELNIQTDRRTDVLAHRIVVYKDLGRAVTSESSDSETTWMNTYKWICRTNRVIESLGSVTCILPEETIIRLRSEARF